MMKKTYLKVERFYGNKGFLFDLIVSIVIIITLVYLNFPSEFIKKFVETIDEATITFFGILFGFILTSFTFLLTFNPQNNEDLAELRKSEAYKKLLYSYISTASIILSFVLILLFLKVSEFMVYLSLQYFILALVLFIVLRVIKCLFYLYQIIELNQSE